MEQSSLQFLLASLFLGVIVSRSNILQLRPETPPPEYTPLPFASPTRSPQITYSLHSLYSSISSPLLPLPSPTYSPGPQHSPTFSPIQQDHTLHLFSPYPSPALSPPPHFSSFTIDDNEALLSSTSHLNNSSHYPSSKQHAKMDLEAATKLTKRRTRNTKLVGVCCCVTMLVLALLITLAVVGVSRGWWRTKSCVRWEDGSLSGDCGEWVRWRGIGFVA